MSGVKRISYIRVGIIALGLLASGCSVRPNRLSESSLDGNNLTASYTNALEGYSFTYPISDKIFAYENHEPDDLIPATSMSDPVIVKDSTGVQLISIGEANVASLTAASIRNDFGPEVQACLSFKSAVIGDVTGIAVSCSNANWITYFVLDSSGKVLNVDPTAQGTTVAEILGSLQISR